MMQASPFSYYNRDLFYEDALKKAVKRCPLSNVPTTAKDSPFPSEPSEPGGQALHLRGQQGDICGGKGVAEVFTTKTKNIVAS
ncbi:putative glucan 1,3-beta-glucosidase [Fusarium circinatum]|uniref:Putative glucan 1,3-beta-glucosidase n=1 Tax=Fusarium circinatum TaxID=48490 RepID=A0A8H5X3Y4_FUSCI|nr:putative glucan 1,3-beta-glucosidase [Fusarium circinatum]